MFRYAQAEVQPPSVIYVDRDCCGQSTIARELKAGWQYVEIRLDIWHFMRRMAACVTTEDHSLYSVFMRQLSVAIFLWDEDDIERLKKATGLGLDELSPKQLSSHCKRKTRGTKETTELLYR